MENEENQNQVSLRFPPPLEIAPRFPQSHNPDDDSPLPKTQNQKARKEPQRLKKPQPPSSGSSFDEKMLRIISRIGAAAIRQELPRRSRLAKSAQGDVFSRYHAEAGIAAEHCLARAHRVCRWDGYDYRFIRTEGSGNRNRRRVCGEYTLNPERRSWTTPGRHYKEGL